ncbi:MAG: hypothetical protein V7K61_31210 [Nostoc sp.]
MQTTWFDSPHQPLSASLVDSVAIASHHIPTEKQATQSVSHQSVLILIPEF